MNVTPLVSVVTPTYQSAHTLPRALRSLQNQTYENWEWVVVDDGSTDHTPAFLSEQSDPRIRHLTLEENQGRGFVRNLTLQQARGEYICALDADDWFYPHKLDQQVQALSSDPTLAAATMGMVVTDDRGELIGTEGRSGVTADKEISGPLALRFPFGPTMIRRELLSTFLLVAFSLAWAHTLKRSHRLSSSLWGYSSLAGFLLGLSVLSRYLHLGLVCMFLATHALLFVVAPAFKLSRKSLAASAFAATMLALLTLSPWLYRNYLLTGELVLSTHGPMRYLYNSNSTLARPETWGYYEAKTVGGEEWNERARELAEQLGSPVPEVDPDRLLHPIIVAEDDSFTTREQKFAKAAALSTRNHPEHVLSLVWGKLVNTWRPVWAGSSVLTWLAVGVPHILLMLLALPGAWFAGRRVWRERDAALFVPLMIVAFYFLAHAVFYGMIRSRLYAIPFLCLLAAFSLWGRGKKE